MYVQISFFIEWFRTLVKVGVVKALCIGGLNHAVVKGCMVSYTPASSDTNRNYNIGEYRVSLPEYSNCDESEDKCNHRDDGNSNTGSLQSCAYKLLSYSDCENIQERLKRLPR